MEGRLLARARARQEEIRIRNRAEEARRREEVYARVPEIRRLDGAIRGLMLELVGLAMGQPGRPGEELERESLALQARREALLRENGVDPRRIRVVYNGLIPRPLPPRQNAVREEFGLGPDCFVMLTMARYAPEKGLPFLLEALALVKERAVRPFVCLIAGDGEGFSALGQEIRRLGLERNVIQAGFRRDTQRLLCSSDLYVSSALYNEAMSFAILEAMECALPVVVTDVGAGRDLAEEGIRCGAAVPPGDRRALAERILELMENDELRLRLGQAAREKAVREFDLRVQARKLLALYGASGEAEEGPAPSGREEPGSDCKTGDERKP